VPSEHADAESIPFEQIAAMVRRGTRLPISLQDPRWTSVYRLHHRGAERLRVGRGGRIFLVGDAAHVHSPVGGQGMNTGIQDATNLAWKLALVVHGAARESLLDTYAEERLPVIRALLRTTDRFFVLATTEQPIAALLRSTVMGALMSMMVRVRAFREFAFRAVSQIGIGYERGSLARRASEAGALPDPAPGERLPHAVFAGDDGAPRSVVELCRSPWFTALAIGDDGSALGRRRRSAPSLDAPHGPEPDRIDPSLAPWIAQRRVAPIEANDALRRALGGSPRLVLVRPDLHVLGAWPIDDPEGARRAVGRALG